MAGNILIVDDEASLRFFAKDYLTRLGWRVYEAKSGEAALAALETTPCDVILLDLQLSGMNGLEVMNHVRERWPQTLIIIVTAYASVDSAIEAIRQGAADYLRKPCQIGDIVAAVSQALARRETYQIVNSLALGGGDAAALADPKWLPQTKFRPFPQRQDLVRRPHLLERVRQAIHQQRLTLISAPAGYGKTALLAEGCSQPGNPISADFGLTDTDRRPYAWLTLDAADNEPTRFFLALIISLRTLQADFGTAAIQFLATTRPADLARSGSLQTQMCGLLVNDITNSLPHPFTLVLEDGHALTEPVIYNLLTTLIEWLPPQAHVVMATRHEPALALPRLRAYGQLAEFRPTDLAFTPMETTTLLNGQYRLNLAPPEISALQRYTEGWPAGLRLLAIALKSLPYPDERAGFIGRLAAEDGQSASQTYIFDYLADEVTKREPRLVQTFLLETSILAELSPAMCRAVTGRTGVAKLLARLQQHNLFLVPYRPKSCQQSEPKSPSVGYGSAPPGTQRYTRFFANFLRHTLARSVPNQVVELHRRAAEAAPTPEQSIDHYLAAGIWEPAIQALKTQADGWLAQGRITALASRLQAIPPTLQQQDPALLYSLGVCAWQQNELDQARIWLSQAFEGFNQIDDAGGRGQSLAALATTALLQADLGQAQNFLERAFIDPLPTVERIQLALNRVWLHASQNDRLYMKFELEVALSTAHKSGDVAARRAVAMHFNPAIGLIPDGLAQLAALDPPRNPTSTRRDRLWQTAIDWQRTAWHWQRGEFDQVLLRGQQVLRRKEMIAPTCLPGEVDVLRLMTLVHLVRAEFDEAQQSLAQLFDALPHYPILKMHEAGFLYLRGRAYWLQQRLSECRLIGQQLTRQGGPLQPALMAALSGLLCQADQDYDSAERHLQAAAHLADEQPLVGLFSRPRLLLAHLYLAWDRPQAALAQFAPLLAEGRDQAGPGPLFQEGGIIVPLLQLAIRQSQYPTFARQLLARLGSAPVRQPTSIPETGETLTTRELEVLELMAAGSSNRSIAQQLNISYFTVKSHITRILRKLSVSAREQAVTHARDLGLLAEVTARL